jgi:hypothetical protein
VAVAAASERLSEGWPLLGSWSADFCGTPGAACFGMVAGRAAGCRREESGSVGFYAHYLNLEVPMIVDQLGILSNGPNHYRIINSNAPDPGYQPTQRTATAEKNVIQTGLEPFQWKQRFRGALSVCKALSARKMALTTHWDSMKWSQYSGFRQTASVSRISVACSRGASSIFNRPGIGRY